MFDHELAVARQAALAGGQCLVRMLGKKNRVMKKGAVDLVTEADLQAEKTILDILGSRFPGDNVLAEEAGETTKRSGRRWIIDPLDGTTNFAHAFPVFAVSIALEVDGDVVLGAIYDPVRDEFFSAEKGKGAFMNDRPIEASSVRDLGEALLATGFPYDVRQRVKSVIALLQRMLVRTQGIRRGGSAALDLCYVAAGRLDALWEEGLKPWDTAAGVLVVREAGGRATDFSGRPHRPDSGTLAASNGLLHEAVLDVLAGGEKDYP